MSARAKRAPASSTPLKAVIKTLDKVLAEHPRAVSLLFERARALDAAGRPSDAELAYQAVIREDPNHFRAFNDLGLLYHRHKCVDEAERCFQLAVRVDPKNAIGATNLAYIFLARNDLQAAKAEFQRALSLQPDHPKALAGLADVLKRLGEGPGQVAEPRAPASPKKGKQTSAEDPFVEYIYDLAANAILSRENDAIRAFLNLTVGHERRYAQLLWRLADFASRQYNYEAALQTFQHAAALEPRNREFQIGIATCYEEVGDFEAAEAIWKSELLRNAIRVFPYTGSGTPVRLLTIASALHSIRFELFVDPESIQNTVVYTQAYTGDGALPEHDVVLVAVGDVESDARALETARAIVARTNAPVLNHPDFILRTSRSEQAARLAELPNVGAARIAPVRRADLQTASGAPLVRELGFEFPFLLRSPGYHNGEFFERVEEEGALAGIAAGMPTEELLALSFQDTRSPDGMTRKFRMMTIGGRLYPIHMAVSPNWKVHYNSSVMQHVGSFRDEEAAYLTDARAFLGSDAMRALERIAESMQLDYGGIDFGISPDGRVAVFEANGAMGLFMPDDDPRWDYRRAAIRAALEAANQMIVDRGQPARV